MSMLFVSFRIRTSHPFFNTDTRTVSPRRCVWPKNDPPKNHLSQQTHQVTPFLLKRINELTQGELGKPEDWRTGRVGVG